MIEIKIKNFLEEKLNIEVFLAYPLNKPKKFVSFEKIGSSYSNQLDSSLYSFQSWGETLEETVILNNELKKALRELIKLDEVAKVDITSDYNFTDITTKKFRYQAVVSINHY